MNINAVFSLRLRAAVTTAAVVAIVGAASGQQPTPDHWTVEALATQARIVFKGYITDIVRLDIDPKPGKPATARLTLTIHTQDRLKGSPDSWMTLDKVILASDTRYDLWMKAKTPLLWFRFSEEDPKAYPGATVGNGLDLPPGQSWSVIHLDKVDPAELTSDPHASSDDLSSNLMALSTGNDKLEAVRKFLKANPDREPVVRITVPGSITAAIGYPTGSQHLVVPANSELEATALKMINSPDSFLGKDAAATDKTVVRAAGVRALGHFKSEKNTALLKTLLTDPGRGPSNTNESATKTFYWVRLAAYSTLTSWSVLVAKPTL